MIIGVLGRNCRELVKGAWLMDLTFQDSYDRYGSLFMRHMVIYIMY